MRVKFSRGSATVLQKMANYQEARVKLTNKQLNKLKSSAKNKTRTILRLNKKNFEDEEMSHELTEFLINISTDIKLTKAQISKLIQSDGSFGSWLVSINKCYYSFS